MVSSSTLAASPSNKVMRDCMDELNVAHALLGVVPKEPKSPLQSATLDSYAGLESLAEQAQVRQVVTSSSVAGSVPSSPALPSSNGAVATGTNLAPEAARAGATAKSVSPRTGLDALAALALQRDTSTSVAPTEPPLRFDGVVSAVASSSDDDEAMPPPPPRRQRSVSNPEGMEKWDSLHRNRGRRHFVLPASILEEELAEASAAVREKQLMKRESPVESLPEEEEEESGESEEGEEVEEEEEEEVDESLLTPEELLRKARSRLLEDLSEGSINGEKGELMLPHALRKYKHVCLCRVGFICIIAPPYLHFSHTGNKCPTGLQSKRPHRHLHPGGACGHYCALQRQTSTTRMEQENSVQLSQESGRSSLAGQGSLCEAFRTRTTCS